MNSRCTIILPTIATDYVINSIESIQNQTISTDIYLVVDGQEYQSKLQDLLSTNSYDNIHILTLPYNVGKNGFYGHRSFAAIPHLINSEYIIFLDEDNWIEPNHVESLIDIVESNGWDWGYSLRNIYDKDKNLICNDNCESLGHYMNVLNQNHIDTSCFILRKSVAIQTSWKFHGGYGQDRVFYHYLAEKFPYYGCSGKYTLNYRLDGNPSSASKEFFLSGNEKMKELYGENYQQMWIKE